MLGSGVSSESIWTAFDTMATASMRVLRHKLEISWLRNQNLSLNWAVVGTSLVGGIDIIQGLTDVLVKPDLFSYNDESDYALKLEYERILNEPLGGISLAQADVTLDNTNLRFTPEYSQTIGTAILPNRPIRMNIGFYVKGQDKLISIIKGLTWRPEEDKAGRSVKVHAFDYIQYLNQYPLEKAIYQNQRSDQIIDDILTTIGYSTDQYELDQGLNTIAFAWFEKGMTAGERIRKICEAEEAHFYQDESGVLRFENRRHYSQSPHGTTQWTFNADDILAWEEDKNVDIINRCIVKGKPREALSVDVEVWRDSIAEEIERGDTLTIWADFENPCVSLVTPVATTDYLANTASDGSGTNKTSNISIIFTAFTKAAKIEITNNAGEKVYMTKLLVRGRPAVVYSEIEQVYQDNDSVAKYETKQLEIENDFIDNDDFAYYLARTIVRKYKDLLKRIRILAKGIPHLQLKDKVRVQDKDLNTYTNYRVMKITGTLSPGDFTQWLTLREIVVGEADAWAIVGTATVGNNFESVGL